MSRMLQIKRVIQGNKKNIHLQNVWSRLETKGETMSDEKLVLCEDGVVRWISTVTEYTK